MSEVGSITHWIHQLKAGERQATQKLWEAYFHRLVRLARTRLQNASPRTADEEDVALSAFNSFFRRAEEGQFPQLVDRDDLWQLLVVITAGKASNLVKHERRQKRGGGRVQRESELPAGPDESGPAFANVIGREPDPEFVVQVTEECRRLLEVLGEMELRSVAVWKMEGYTNGEIAAKLGRNTKTIERKLRLIRDIWKKR